MNKHMKLLLARANNAVDALDRKGCKVLSVTIDGAMPLISIDRPPVDGPGMVVVIRSNGQTPRTVLVAEMMGCRVEAPARKRAQAWGAAA